MAPRPSNTTQTNRPTTAATNRPTQGKKRGERREAAADIGQAVLQSTAVVMETTAQMMGAVPTVASVLAILGGVTALAGKVIEQASQAKANKAQCARLAERIDVIRTAIDGLEETRLKADPSRYARVLRQLKQTLLECQEVVTKLSGRGWVKRLVLAGVDKETFDNLYRQLAEQLADLQLGLNVQQLLNQEESRVDAEKDRQALKDNQGEMLAALKTLQKETGQHGLKQEEFERVLRDYMKSVQAQLTQLAQQSGGGSPYSSLRPQEGATLVPFHTVEIEEKCWEGALSRVYRGRWHEQTVAVKVLKHQASPEEKADFAREVAITQRLNSPHIVQLYGACVDGGHLALITEYMDGGSLENYVAGCPSLTLGQQYRWALDLAQGLYYLHSQGLYHRDLTASNVLLNQYGQIKITDFGLAKTKSGSIKTLGTRYTPDIKWVAPELFERGVVYTEQSDIYSLGLLLWVIVAGRLPSQAEEESPLVPIETRCPIPEHAPAALVQLIKQCWSREPAQRPSAQAVVTTLRQEERLFYGINKVVIPGGFSAEVYYQAGLAKQKEKSYQEAEMYFHRAAELGYVRAQTEQGLLYVQHNHQPTGGIGSGKEQGHALLWMSAKQGHGRAMSNLGYQLEKGDGISASRSKALFWYQQAAEQGDKLGQSKVAQLTTAQPRS
ncbi:MAG: protein kinase [Gammaproteobacteria bacterium]